MRNIRGVLCIIAVISFLTITIITASSISTYQGKQDLNIEKIDEDLKEIIKTGSKDEKVNVIIVLKKQPAHDISIKVKEKYQKDFEDISKPAREIYSRIKPLRSTEEILIKKSISESINDDASLLTEQEKTILKNTAHKIDQKRNEMRREILSQTAPISDNLQKPLISRIEAKGGKIKYRSQLYNAISADIPISIVEEFSKYEEIYFIFYDHIMTASLDVSAQAMGANTWWNNDLNGSETDVAIIDTGINGSHPNLSVDYSRVFHATAITDSNYSDDPESTDDFRGHGTHIAGIIASTYPIYGGIAPGIDKLINAKAGWKNINGSGSMYFSDAMEAINWSIFGNEDDADVISYSFGGPPREHSAFEHFMDAISYSLDIPIVVAAGNNGSDPHTVGEPARAFNILAVGNIDDNNTIDRTDDFINSSSSRGPTLYGRIKPDISAPGTNITSTNNKWETEDDFISMSGTSMAAPHVAGAVLLIMDHMNTRGKPESIKALLMNTAEDKGSAGPDNSYGYGYVDLSNAYFHRDDVFNGTINNFPNGSVEKFYRGTVYEEDRATLVWNRHILYNGVGLNNPNYNPYYNTIASDLDLYLYNETNGSQLSSSISGINNSEQVNSSANHSAVILKVDPYGTYPNGITSEEFALATEEGFYEVAPPILNVNVSVPGSVNGTDNFDLEVNVTNTGGISVHNVSVNITLPSGFSIISGTNPRSIGSINNGSSNTTSWIIKAPRVSFSSSYTLNVSAISLSYGEYFSGIGNNTILVNGDGYINGTVRCNGVEIQDASVTTDNGDFAATNSTGYFSIMAAPVLNYLTVTHEPEHYPNSSIEVIAISSNTVIQDIELMEKPKGSISGEVRNI